MATSKRGSARRFAATAARQLILSALSDSERVSSGDDEVTDAEDATEDIPNDVVREAPGADLAGSDSEVTGSDEGDVGHQTDDRSSNSNTESEASNDETDIADKFRSRKGNELWSKTAVTVGRQSNQNIMKGSPGPTAFAVRQVKNISDTLGLFITKRMTSLIIEMTNKEGTRVFGDEWQLLNIVELNAFLGLLLLAGVHRSCNEATEELWHLTDGRSVFRATMSLKRFKHISRVIRFDDRETRTARRARDKLAPIRELYDMWANTLSQCFLPYQNVTVDEHLVKFRGRCPFRQFMKSKPGKYGIKVWMLCDSATSYALNLQVYTGRETGQPPEKNQGERVVHDMVDVVKGSGRNVTSDNFFTSVQLARQLLTKKLSLVGTLRKNKGEIPQEFLPHRNRPVHSSLFGHQPNLTLVSYVPKKNRAVLLLSSMHKDAEISDRPDQKPEIILEYNRTKGGVDTLDQMVALYSVSRMTRRWPMVLFYDIVDISAVNAYIIWRHIDPNWNENKRQCRRLFLKELGNSLIQDQLQARLSMPGLSKNLQLSIQTALGNASADEEHQHDGMQETEADEPRDASISSTGDNTGRNVRRIARKRGRCGLCSRQHDKKTRTVCEKCQGFACSDHSVVLCKRCSQ